MCTCMQTNLKITDINVGKCAINKYLQLNSGETYLQLQLTITIYNMWYGLGIIKFCSKCVCDSVVLCRCGGLVMYKFYNICTIGKKWYCND